MPGGVGPPATRPGFAARRLDPQHATDGGGTNASFARNPHARVTSLVEAARVYFLLRIPPLLAGENSRKECGFMHLILFCSFLSAYHRTTEYTKSSAILTRPTLHSPQAECTSSHLVTLRPFISYTVNPQSLIPNLLSVSTTQSNIHIIP